MWDLGRGRLAFQSSTRWASHTVARYGYANDTMEDNNSNVCCIDAKNVFDNFLHSLSCQNSQNKFLKMTTKMNWERPVKLDICTSLWSNRLLQCHLLAVCRHLIHWKILVSQILSWDTKHLYDSWTGYYWYKVFGKNCGVYHIKSKGY